MAFERGLLKSLAERDLIMPYFELGMLSENWPDKYPVWVDSGEYYGKGDGMFHPSTHPLMGSRELYYHFHPATRDKIVPQRRTAKDHMVLSMGTALHAVVQTQMKMVGLVACGCPEDAAKHDCGRIEVDFDIPEHRVRGRIDMLVDHPTGEELIIEVKTINERGFKWQHGHDEMKPEWDAQMSLQEYALGKTRGVLLMIERGGQLQMREFLHRRNDILLDQIFEKFAYVRGCIERDEPPRHCCMPDSPEMKKCAARFSCWLKPEGE